MDDVECGYCLVACCAVCCASADSGSSSSAAAATCCCFVLAVAALALAALLVAAYAFVVPVRVTVDEATLGRLALAPPAPGSNGTSTAASVAYDVSLAVVLRNRNWAMAVWLAGPLDTELRFPGQPFARARLAGAERDKIRALGMEVYLLAAAAGNATLALGSDGAAELSRESAAGVFELELAVFVEVSARPQVRQPAEALAVHGDGAGGVHEDQVRVGVHAPQLDVAMTTVVRASDHACVYYNY